MTTILALAALSSNASAAAPDLTFDNISAVYDAVHNEITTTITVKNIGDAWSASFYVDSFSSSNWATCADLDWTWATRSGLAPGAVGSVTVTLDADLAADQPVYFFVDLDNYSVEANENNNEGMSYYLEADPDEPVVSKGNFWMTNPACLSNFVFNQFGWNPGGAALMFYSKIRIL